MNNLKTVVLAGLLIYNTLAIAQMAKFEPLDGKIYHGVGQSNKGEEEYMTALIDSSIFPLVRSRYFAIPSTRPDKLSIQYASLRGSLDSLKAGGFIPEISVGFIGPLAAPMDVEIAQSQYDSIIDTLATIIKQYSKRVFVRPGYEFNGSWNGYHKYHYANAFKKIVDRFKAIGVADSCAFIWCYEPSAPNDFDKTDSNGAWWYPGDDYVDWFGLDVFDVNQFGNSFPDSSNGNITNKGKTERFIKMAVQKGKPVHISETTAKKVEITADSLDGVNDWDTWFVPFWEFMSNHPEIKGFNYINWNWKQYPTWVSWGDARIEKNNYIVSKYREEMLKSKYIHLKGSIPDTTNNGGGTATTINYTDNFNYTLFPNPCQDYVQLGYNSEKATPYLIDLYSALGEKLKLSYYHLPEGEHTSNLFIDMSSYPAGIYYCRLSTSQKNLQLPIVKIK